MPTARHSPGILSLQSALLVAGGCISTGTYTNAVEMFRPSTSQWYTTDPLPTPCSNVTLVNNGNKCYAVGGYSEPSHLNQCLVISIDDLLDDALPATIRNTQPHMRTIWRQRPNTPTYLPTAVVLAGNLLAIGGREALEGGHVRITKDVYVYSASTKSWVSIGELPAPRHLMAVVVLPSAIQEPEILVIGGWCDGKLSTVYQGTLNLKLC